MERSTSDLVATMPTGQQHHFTQHRDNNFKTKIKQFCSKLNDYMDTVLLTNKQLLYFGKKSLKFRPTYLQRFFLWV